ncbi:MAG: ABC transporter ATP-binding protein [Dehalococcoidia bacterium]|nr:ABC transporter ATP-binding protein [Dehalococcoidia bacterium]
MLRVVGVDVYYGDLQALQQVSLDVNAGEIVTLIGSNGAGKTTTLRTISGLLTPRSGFIEFLGQTISDLPPHRIVGMGIAHVPEGRRLFPQMTVRENLELGSYALSVKEKESHSLSQVFEAFPVLKERQSQLAGTLSGGEQQMVAIGRALMSAPKLLMLDEPSLGLAPLIVNEIFRILEMIRQQGVAVLLVEQNTFHALRLTDRAYVLENGQLLLSGSGRELLGNSYVRSAYLGLG